MATTVYCVQAFWHDGRKLAKGRLRQFLDEDLARQAGRAASGAHAGVVVFRVRGEPEFETWSEPEVLDAYGTVPEAD